MAEAEHSTKPSDFWGDCSQFVGRHICKILITLSLGLFGATVAGVTWYVSAQDEFDRITQSTDARSLGNTQAIDQLTSQTRKVADGMEQMQTAIGDMQGDLKVLMDRSDRGAHARFQMYPYIAKPE